MISNCIDTMQFPFFFHDAMDILRTIVIFTCLKELLDTSNSKPVIQIERNRRDNVLASVHLFVFE